MPSNADRDVAQIHFQRNLDVDGCRYQVTVASAEDAADLVHVEVLGVGPGSEATQGTLAVSTTALPHLGPLLAEVLGGIAEACGIATPSSGSAPARPGNAGQPWTDERKADLRRRWLAVDSNIRPAQALRTIAEDLDRTVNSIRSALLRQHLDPDAPGRQATSPAETSSYVATSHHRNSGDQA